MMELTGKRFAILGDSYSTFRGFIPAENEPYYPDLNAVPDVRCVEDTWWHRLAESTGMVLTVNDSYSGSTVCTQVREGHPIWNSYVRRAETVDYSGGGTDPDYILIFGGTNDSWLEREIGEPLYEEATAEQLRQVLPAFCHVLKVFARRYPHAKLVAVVNTELDPRIMEGMAQAAVHLGAKVAVLSDIEKYNSHPTSAGMAAIARQVEAVL